MMTLDNLSQLQLLIGIYYDPRTLNLSDTSQLANAKDLARRGLVELGNDGYQTTARGDVYVQALASLPLPVQTWSMLK